MVAPSLVNQHNEALRGRPSPHRGRMRLMQKQRRRRLFMIDRRITHVQDSLRDDLGRWAERRKASIILKRTEAARDVRASGQSAEFLREQWGLQRAAQLSIRKRTWAPTLSSLLDYVKILLLASRRSWKPSWCFNHKSKALRPASPLPKRR